MHNTYNCDFCEEGFLEEHNLLQHREIHSDKKTFRVRYL